MERVRTVRVYAFVKDEMFAMFFEDQSLSAVRAQHTDRSCNEIVRTEGLSADFSQILAVTVVVIVDKVMRGTAQGQIISSGMKLPFWR